ncbi:MAG: zinc-dependent metalloprotease [Phycisphaerae bacterium]|nr:zinc-dependent metalloprotease [Phycisphaerae bacterium]MCZ2399626.1 zinc-dependent metalloprotease [Phycisphaerae bacterium]
MRLQAKWLAALIAAAGAGLAPAQEGAASDERKALAEQLAIDIASIMGQMGGMSAAVGGEGALPKFEQVTKDMVSKPGLFTLWYYPESAQDKDQQRLLAQIPSGFLGEQFMLSTSISGGGFFTAFPNYERVVRWELMDRQVLLIEPETRFVLNPGDDVSDAVRRTYPERILATCPLVTKAPSGDPVIDLGPLLKSEFADVGWTGGGGGDLMDMLLGGAAHINPLLSKWTKRKAFELNVEVAVELAIAQPSPPGSFEKRGVHYSFWKLPQTDYEPRVADDRVGYFLTMNRDWAKPTSARDIYNRYINRWHLVKRDPSLELCEPRTPIVFYIEKTVPLRFRRAVRDGILEWNKAFEKCGFVNAVEVRQQTDDNEWKDLDPEDMRYSFFRWIVTGAGFAMGPSRANPFTGQIYDADIVFDDSMVRYFEIEAEHYLPSAMIRRKFSDPALRQFLADRPEWGRDDTLWRFMRLGEPGRDALRDAAMQRLHGRGLCLCDYARRMKHETALGGVVLAGQPREVIDRFLYDIIKEVVMHEVGHTLGLRHNFKASSIYTLEEIQKRRNSGQATTGSVMDYNAALLLPDRPTEGHFVTPTIGPYDYWAIEYGYRPYDGRAPAAEKTPEPSRPRAAPAQADASEAPPRPHAAKAAVEIDLDDIPAEVLAQMPADVRRAIESGDTAKLMALAKAHGMELDGDDDGDTPVTPLKAAAAPDFKAAPPGEAEMLAQIAGRATEPELTYATDEDTTFLAPDPSSNRFDVGKDPVEWAEARLRLVHARMKDVLEWAVRDQESWYHLRGAFLTLYFEKLQILDYVGRYIGGQYFSRAHRGDKDAPPPFVIVDAALQRRALKFTAENLFRDEYFNVPPDVLNHLAPPRWWDFDSSIDMSMDFPVREYVALAQWWNLFDRFFPNNLRRIHDAELKAAGGDVLTLAEYLQTLQKACWDDVAPPRAKAGGWTDAKPFLSGHRRSLQREYLGLLETLIREQPGRSVSPDIHAMLTLLARDLSDEIGQTLDAGRLDFASRAHLAACKSRIDRALSAQLPENRPSGGGMSLMRTADR